MFIGSILSHFKSLLHVHRLDYSQVQCFYWATEGMDLTSRQGFQLAQIVHRHYFEPVQEFDDVCMQHFPLLQCFYLVIEGVELGLDLRKDDLQLRFAC